MIEREGTCAYGPMDSYRTNATDLKLPVDCTQLPLYVNPLIAFHVLQYLKFSIPARTIIIFILPIDSLSLITFCAFFLALENSNKRHTRHSLGADAFEEISNTKKWENWIGYAPVSTWTN